MHAPGGSGDAILQTCEDFEDSDDEIFLAPGRLASEEYGNACRGIAFMVVPFYVAVRRAW